MDCAGCGRTNPSDARFCGGCGSALAPRCPACGVETQADARFCIGCGAVLEARPAADAVSRKIVTIVFADLIGSVSLHERLDAESARRLMDRYHRAMSAAVDVHGGRVVQLLGDGVLAAFGVPRVAEDDAIRAVRAAVGMQRTFRELAREQGAAMEGVGLRVAVNTGEIVVSDDENSVMGDPTNVAARLQQEARDGDVIVGEGTQRLVRELVTLAPLGSFALRGRAETVAAYRVVSLDRPASQQAIAFVGRDEELRRLTVVYDAAVAAPAAQLAVLLGSPGLGKSRLVAEFTRRAGERATVLAARCDAAGGATFAPLAEALRALLRIDEGAGGDVLRAAIDAVVSGDDAERTRIATGIGALLAGTPAPPEETFFVVRRLLAALAAVRPVVLVIDDLQWAEPLLLDLVEHLVQWSSGVPLLVLVAARPELRDARSSLATPGPLVADVVTLTGLDASAATRLAANVIGGSELPAALAGRVLATSEGNPLFVAELVRMLVQDGTLVREGERWITTVEVAKLDMPASIQVLLAARIERLRPEERSVLERAAVVGRQFSRAAVAHLLGATPELDARLEALRRSELIEPDTGWFLGEPALRFHHVLIRDAAYRRVLKETRAELHERLADWIVARVGDAIEHDETIGWHLEQAHQNLRDLGPLDARGASLGERAANHLGAAGRRALARDDLALAAGLLGRAIDRLATGDPARADLALDWCEALLAAGDVGPAAAAIEELARLGTDSERLRAWHTCFAGQLAALTDPQSLRATADAVASAAEVLATAGDATGEAKAHSVRAAALARLGAVGACETALDLALAAARRARDRRRANAVLAGAPVAALWGPSPVTRASGRCLDVVRVLRITQGAPAVEAVALRCQAVLETLRGRGDAARRMIASSRRMVEELGITQQLLESDVFAGMIELLEGDAEAAEQWLRAAYDGLRERGLGIDAARAAALLGRALLAQGRAVEAESLSHESEALAGDDLKAAIAWRGVRAEALALRGDPTAAVELARAAVAIAAATDALLDHADARSALATALRAAGRGAEADAEAVRAIDLWEAKGATLLVERAPRASGRVAASDLVASRRTEATHSATRRMPSNFATEFTRRLNAAIAARDSDALLALWSEDAVIFHHPTRLTYQRDAAVARFRAGFEAAADLAAEHVPLAALGTSLGLSRLEASAEGLILEGQSYGAIEHRPLVVAEANERSEAVRVEIFADDHLSDAIARLYERFAELQPEGAARDAAATTARTVALTSGIAGTDDLGEVMTEDVVFVDHRLLGFGTLRGVAALGAGERQIRDFTDDRAMRTEEIYALRPDRLLVRVTTSGTDRRSGGRYERPFLDLRIFGADGRVLRREWFDIDREAEALARFDELTTPQTLVRRVRPNAATALLHRMRAANAARDLAALSQLLADDLSVVHHPTLSEFGRDGTLSRFAALYRAEDLVLVNDPIATLGDSLVLSHTSMSVSALADDDIAPAGAVRIDTWDVREVDAQGRQRRIEIFAIDHLADAIARLYERYAELLPEGPERDHAAATAHAVAIGFVRIRLADPAEEEAALAADIEFVDHRLLGFPSARGAAAVARSSASLRAVADDIVVRLEDVLDLRPEGYVSRGALTGTDRVGGGPFERRSLTLRTFGADGRQTRVELFEIDREADALARFDEVTSTRAPAPVSPRRRVRPNGAVTCGDRVRAAALARGIDAIADLLADGFQVVDNRSGLVIDREGGLARWRLLFGAEGLTVSGETLATLGDSLALARDCTSFDRLADSDLSFGTSETRTLIVFESNDRGQCARIDVFPETRLADAIVRLYERYAELLPEGPARKRAATTARCIAALFGDDLETVIDLSVDDCELRDHRRIGLFEGRGKRLMARSVRSYREMVEDSALRVDEILGVDASVLLVRSLVSGTDRRAGGRVESERIELRCFGADGRQTLAEVFEPDRTADALARFDAIAAPRAPAHRVRANAATAHAARMDAAVAAHDLDAFLGLLADGARAIHHQTGAVYEEREARRAYEILLANEHLVFGHAPIATLGDSLALCRSNLCIDNSHSQDLPFGASNMDSFVLMEVDATGRRRATEFFALDKLTDAICRLYARHAELASEGSARERAALTARAVEGVVLLYGSDYLQGFPEFVARDYAFVDHRLLGFESSRGVEGLIAGTRSMHELADDLVVRVEEVFDLRAEGFVVRSITSGRHRSSGGRFEREAVQIRTFDAAGRLLHTEWFDTDRVDEALARFDALTAEAPEPRFANAAWRAQLTLHRSWRERRWDDVVASVGPAFALEDRRSIVRLDLAGADFLTNLRMLFGMRESQWQAQLLATRGERLVLTLARFTAELSGGAPIEFEHLAVSERDAEGGSIALVLFDLDAIDAAYAELDRRYAAGEGAPHAALLAHWGAFRAATNAREWETAGSLLPDDFSMYSHRSLASTGMQMDRDTFITSLGWGDERGVRSVLRRDHLRVSARAAVEAVTLIGNADGGDFEQEFVLVFGHDGSRLRSCEAFDLDQLGPARARFEALSREPAAAARIENGVTRAERAIQRAWNTRDWDAFAALVPAQFRSIDRRRLMHLELDRDGILAGIRPFFETGVSRSSELLATRGERFALFQVDLRGSDGLTGPSEVEFVQVIETDALGRRIAAVAFDPDDLDAAYAELDARYHAGEAAAHPSVAAGMREFSRAFAARDWEALAARCAPEIAVRDHRRLGWETLHGPDAYVHALRTLVELAPDTALRLDHVEMCAQGYLVVTVWSGTRDGGAFEEPSLMVAELDAAGRILHFDQYELERLAEARARYASIGAPASSDPLRIPPNAATRAGERLYACALAGDWDALRDLCAPIFFDDRRPLFRLSGGCELIVANTQAIDRSIWERSTRTLLATAGDRLALHYNQWRGDEAAGAFEVDNLEVTEVDAEGRVVAAIVFDPGDRRAAGIELIERSIASDPDESRRALRLELSRAVFDHDVERFRAALPDDWIYHDHRRVGAGRLGKEEYVGWLATLFAESPDALIEPLYVIATEAHAILSVGHTFGRRTDGGAFESVYLQVWGRSCVEMFELDDLEHARARFDALRSDSLRIPPNAATRTSEVLRRRRDAHDWDGVAALCSASMLFDDRRRGALVRGDRDAFLASVRFVSSHEGRLSATLLATAGDRLALRRLHVAGTAGGGAVESELLSLIEVDAEGRIVALIAFDAEDRRAAAAEMFERFHARTEEGSRRPASQIEFTRALFAHDRARMRAALPDDFSFRDHRTTGIGPEGTADDYVAWMAAAMEQSDDLAVETLYHVAIAEHGTINLGRAFGTLRDGGAFESVVLRINRSENGRWAGVEVFEPDDLARARVRFEELGREHATRRADPLRIPPNAATRASDRMRQALEAKDWDAFAALFAPSMVFDDRRRGVRLIGDRAMFLASVRVVSSHQARVSYTLLATTGDRLALRRLHFAGTTDGGGAFEAEALSLLEVDAEGRVTAIISFDLDDRRAANLERNERYFRSDAARSFPAAATTAMRALNECDLDGLRAALPADFFLDDHRRTGLGRIESAGVFVDSMAAIYEQVPDLLLESLYTITVSEFGALEIAHMFGTLAASGGAVEGVYVRLFVYHNDRILGMELFEVDDLARARARFEELRPDPLRIAPNAATRAHERLGAAFGARDWAAVRALASPDFAFADRRRRALIEGDIELWVRNLAYVRDMPALQSRPERIGALGDRIALTHIRYGGESAVAGFEGDFIQLIETAPDGLLRAVVHFDPEDRAAAFVEAHSRFAAGEAANVGGQAPIAALGEAFGNHDWEAVRAGFASDAVLHDQRTLGLGVITVDAWIESLRVFADLAPDLGGEQFQILAWNRHGRVCSMRNAGTRDGGAFENVFVGVFLTEGERIRRFELFDVADADRALARFEALCAERSQRADELDRRDLT